MANENRDGATGQQGNLVATFHPSIMQENFQRFIRLALDFNRVGILRSSVDANDIEVLNSRGQVDTRFSIGIGSGGLDYLIRRGSLTIRAVRSTIFNITPDRHQVINENLRIRLKARSLRQNLNTNDVPTTAITSQSFLFDNRTADTARPLFNNTTGGLVLQSQLSDDLNDIAGLEAADIEIIDDSDDTVQSGWTVRVSASSANPGVAINVDGIPPTGVTSGSFYFRLKRLSIRTLGSTTNNVPLQNVPSVPRSLSSLVVTWGTPAYCETSNRVTTTLSFGNRVTGLTVSDIEVRNEANTMAVSGWSHTITGSGNSYTITSTPPTDTIGDFKLRLKMNSVSVLTRTGPSDNEDSALFNVGGEMASITMDGGTFCMTSRRITWQAYITGANSSQVGQLDTADTTLNNTVSTGASFIPTETVTRTPSTGSSYRIQTSVIPTGRVGNMSVTIRANALGTNSNRFGVTSGCVSYDTRPPTPITPPPDEPPGIAIDSGSFCPTNRRVTWTAYITSASNIELSAFNTADTRLNNIVSMGANFMPTVTVSRTSGSASFRIETSVIPLNRVGDISLSISANALGENTNKAITSGCVAYDTRPPEPVITSGPYLVISGLPSMEQTGASFTFTVNGKLDGADINIDGLTADDFVITSPAGTITPTISR